MSEELNYIAGFPLFGKMRLKFSNFFIYLPKPFRLKAKFKNKKIGAPVKRRSPFFRRK